jgi:hypothetical protein
MSDLRKASPAWKLAVATQVHYLPFIRRHSKALARIPCRNALARIPSRNVAHSLDRNALARSRDTHHAGVLCRPERRPRGTDR